MLQCYRNNTIDKCMGEFPCRRLPNQNIVTKLAHRQAGIDSPSQLYYRQRSFYQCLVPDHTESNVQIPSGFLRKFTPDGNQLLAFSNDQKNVNVYDYMGAGASQHLYVKDVDTVMSEELVKDQIFDRFFRLRFSVPVTQGNENLNRECSLFTDDEVYVVVGSSMPIPDEAYPQMYETFRNNESVVPNARSPLEDYSLYIIDMRGGIVSDSRPFKCDKIYLSHNQGLSLCDSTLAVLSVQHQTIHLFQIQNGTFLPVQDIGRFCYPGDEMVFAEARLVQPELTLSGASDEYIPFHEKWYNSLKHRFLCWILRRAEEQCTTQSEMPLANFFWSYDYLSSLKIWKMQLLGDHHLLLKFATEDIVTLKQSDPTSQPAFFAIYDIESTEILAIYENTSDELLRIYENHADSFRIPVSHPLAQQTSSVSNNAHAKALHMKFKQTITSAKYGGRTEATRRLLGQLPICSQSYSCSPYLDLALFSYDDKWVSALERPKQCGDSPVK